MFEAWAPGRVNLIGEHTDYSGGLVLPVAIQLGVSLRVHERSERIELGSERFGASLRARPPVVNRGSGAILSA